MIYKVHYQTKHHMKKFLIALLILSSCNTKQNDVSKQAAKEIWSADTAMSNLAKNEGFYQALTKYADDSVIIPREGRLPMIGKTEVAKTWAEKPMIKELTWYPIRSEASQTGEIGYSFGYATYQGKDTTTYTNYCTIWKKQKGGSWKFVYDAGNNIPSPFK
jgi:ketosteroid isomerase-like protein